MHLKGRKLGEILVALKMLDEKSLKEALDYAEAWLCPLGQACIEMGLLDEKALTRALSVQLGAPAVDLKTVGVSPEILGLIPPRTAAERRVIPLAIASNGSRNSLIVAVSTPRNPVLDELGFLTGYRVTPVLASDADIDAALIRLYHIDPTNGVEEHASVNLSGGPGLEHIEAGYFELQTPKK